MKSSYKKRKYSGGTRTYKKSKNKIAIKSNQKGYLRKAGNYKRYEKNGEMKWHDGSETITGGISATGHITMSGTWIPIAQGTTESERIGRKICVKKIMFSIRMWIPSFAAMTNTSDEIRIVLYQDKQCNGATILTNDLLTATDTQAWRKLVNSGRFKFLYDKTVLLETVAAIAIPSSDVIKTGIVAKMVKGYFDVNIPIEYSSTTGAITEIRSNNIGMMMITTAALIDIALSYRIRYTDN